MVYRAGTDSIVTGASVYYDGTMSGTTTDKSGKFELPARSKQIPIVVSCIGYDSKTVSYKPGQALIVYLDPKIKELGAVTIVANGMDRKLELQLFTREFIGTSDYAQSCTILNPDDIDLHYNLKTKTLTAGADQPILIENKKLGYIISYYLHRFTKTPTNIAFDGNFNFKEIEGASSKTKIIQSREDVYAYSRMRFIRALWNHQLHNYGFTIFNKNWLPITEDSLVLRDSAQQKYIHGSEKVIISNGTGRNSYFINKDKLSYIDKQGFYGPGLQWGGTLGNQRIGDLLPFDYISEKDKTGPGIVKSDNEISNGQPFFEKVYLHTDRDLYTQGDTIWYKAYIVNAQNNRPVDASGNLYVELIQPDSAKIITRQVIRMDEGFGNGDLALTDSLPSGKYLVRAYTNRIRNFGDNFIFTKQITVLNTARTSTAYIPQNPVSKTSLQLNSSFRAAQSNPTVRFYPESGSLVEGLSSIVAVKAEDRQGRGITATGLVVSSTGDTLARFNCDTLGMGLFVLSPLAGQKFHAIVSTAIKKI